MSADSPRRTSRGVPAIVPPQVVSDRSIIDSVAGFINDVTLTNQPQVDPKDTITWARFESTADISDPTFGDDWELEGNVAPPLLLILGYGLGVQVWAIPANGEAVEVLSWRHGHVTALRILPTPISSDIEMADEPIDQFADKRPLMAICEGSPPGCNSQFSSVNFITLKEGTQVKTIKFKNTVLDILANRTSIVITFPERIAVFDARTFEDRLSVTSCYPSPGINPNPVALGSRWMAYSENRLIHSKRSGGGCDGDGVSSYTATVLNAAKSLGKGLRELGEQVAAGLTGTGAGSSKPGSFDSVTGDIKQPGVITILDIKHAIKDVSPTTGSPISIIGTDPFVAHFVAHLEAIVALEFDNSGMLLLTADKRGHDFHVFRIQPHPAGSQLAAVHHLYVLHRGDTSAKVQNIAFSVDSRWVAVSTLRGTTHVFPINPYGGPAGFRTHASLHVVNRLSRFHRSAGLSADGRSSSPIPHSDSTTFNQVCMPYNNPTIPPFPRPHIVLPLAQLRQPSVLGSPPGSAQNSYTKSSHGRQRLSSLSDDNGKPLSVCAVFAKARSWLLDPPNLTRETPAHKIQRKAVDSLFIMAGHGALIQYDLDTKLASNVAKEKICDDTPIELEVEAKAQWNLGRRDGSVDIQPPLAPDNWLMKERNSISCNDSRNSSDDEDRWLSQVEIITHAGPHRRLWMGPQCVFKTYNTPSGAPLSHIDTEAVEVGVNSGSTRPGRSSPMNMPLSSASRSTVPVLIESGSYSSIEQSPKLMDRFRHEHMDSDFALAHGESRLKEDLADAMRESPSVPHKETGLTPTITTSTHKSSSSSSQISSLPQFSNKEIIATEIIDEDCYTDEINIAKRYSEDLSHQINPSSVMMVTGASSSSSSSLNPSPLPSRSSSTTKAAVKMQLQHQQTSPRSTVLIEKVVNPLGTVTTITRSPSDSENDTNPSVHDYVIHENCDEALFRPVVAIFCDDDKSSEFRNRPISAECQKPPEPIGTELIVPVIEKVEASNKKTGQNNHKNKKSITGGGVSHIIAATSASNSTLMEVNQRMKSEEKDVIAKFDELSLINKKSKTTATATTVTNIAKKQQQSKNEKEKTPTMMCEKSNLSCEGENCISTKKRKKSREEIKRTEEICQQSTKCVEKSRKDDDMKSTIVVEEKKKVQSSKKIDEKQIEICQLEEIQDKPEFKKNESNNKSKKSITKQSLNTDNESLKKVSEFPKGFSKDDKKKNASIEDRLDEKVTAEDCVRVIKQLPKVASDPKLSKCKIIESTSVGIKQASSEKSLKPKKEKNSKQQQQSKNGNSKQKSLGDEVDGAAKSENIENDPIQFYEKFSRDSPQEKSSPKEILLTQLHDIDVDFSNLIPSITSSLDVKKIKKSKQGSPNISSPEHSPKLSSKKSQKDMESVLFDAKIEDNTTSFTETATITLTTKKKSKKSSTSEEPTKEKQQLTTVEVDNLLNNKTANVENHDKKTCKTKDFPALSFEPISTNLSETFLPPLSPLEPFETKFENLYFKDTTADDDHVSLINFESPLQETKKSKSIENVNCRKSSTAATPVTAVTPNRKCSEENLIFALCNSLHYDENSKNSENMSQQPLTFSTIESESDKDCSKGSQYKSFERLNDNDDQYLSLEPNNYHEHTSASSSEETEESSCLTTGGKKSGLHDKLIDDDEELRPLIGGANSACSMTSSTSAGGIGGTISISGMDKKTDDDNISIAEIAKAITKPLPDNNQSDSSDQANSSEPGETDVDLVTGTSGLSQGSGLDDNDIQLQSATTTATIKTTLENNKNTAGDDNNLIKQHQQAVSSSLSNIGCCGGGGSGTQINGKKKSKKKKR